MHLPVSGLHNVSNALAATAAALAMGVPHTAIAQGLENYSSVVGRLQRLTGINGAVVIDDSYNANPASVHAAIEVLKAQPGEKILVLGDMGEMGEGAEELHAELGRYAKACEIERLMTLGDFGANIAAAFGAGALHYASSESLTADLVVKMNANIVVLVKGSRFMKMERIVKAITGKDAQQTHGGH